MKRLRQLHWLCLLASACGSLATASTLGSSGNPQIPFSFVENRGQAPNDVRYIGIGPEFKAWFHDNGVTMQQGEATANLWFDGSGSLPAIRAADPTGGKVNYLRSPDPKQWHAGLPMFGSLHYEGVWPGVEIRVKAEDSRAKIEYVLAPGATVDEIRLRFDGKASVRPDGSLVVSNQSGEFRENAPVIFQESGRGRVEVPGSFRILPGGRVGFDVPAYDHSKPLIVDPTILFSGYFGGSSQSTITGVAINSYYNTVVTGWTVGTDLPSTGSAQSHNGGGVDAFVAAFSPAGGRLLYCTYLGGTGDDRAFGIAVDPSNNTYITGWTSSKNFPLAGAVQTKLKGARNAFVTKLNATGSAILYSTYLGGTGVDTGYAITLDSSNAAIITGDTTSTNLPVSAGAFRTTAAGGQDAFVAKLSASGGAITWLTYLGGTANEHASSVKADATNAVFVGGSTYSSDFPVAQAFQAQSAGGQDGFIAKLASDGRSLLFGTYLGGSGGSPGAPEQVNGIALGPNGILLIAGTTSSANFPTTSVAPQPVFGGGQTDGFMCRLDAATGALQRASFLGGSGDDAINGIVTDVVGAYYMAGYTSSVDFPATNASNAAQRVNSGGLDAFFVKSNATKILFAMYLGGSGNDSANAIAIDSLTNVVVAGNAGSGIPVLGSVGAAQGSSVTSFITKIAPNFTLSVAASPSFFFDVWHNTGYNGPNVTLNGATFGNAGDVPLMGDWDGTGRKRMGVFRNGTWILDINGNGVIDAADKTIAFGQTGDVPVIGDWNGTGRIKLGLYRQGSFILDLSGHLAGVATGLSDVTFAFGAPTDVPVVADWNGSGSTKVGVYRNGSWLIDYSGTNTWNKTYTYGSAGAIPVVGDWNSSGLANQIGVYQSGYWTLNILGNNVMQGTGTDGRYELRFSFGGSTYVPLVY